MAVPFFMLYNLPMKNLLLLLIIGVILFGCATTPIPTDQASLVPQEQILDNRYLTQEPGTGEVVIKKDSGIKTGITCASRVWIDGVPIVDIRSAEKIILYLPEGDHIFSAGTSGIGLCTFGTPVETTGSIKIGKLLTIRIGLNGGNLFIAPTAF